jgi:hypothetical protein
MRIEVFGREPTGLLLARFLKQQRGVDFKRRCQALEDVNGGGITAAFKRTHVGSVYMGGIGEFFLRHAGGLEQLLKIGS